MYFSLSYSIIYIWHITPLSSLTEKINAFYGTLMQIKNLYIYIWVYVKYIFSTYIWKHIHSIVSSDFYQWKNHLQVSNSSI